MAAPGTYINHTVFIPLPIFWWVVIGIAKIFS